MLIGRHRLLALRIDYMHPVTVSGWISFCLTLMVVLFCDTDRTRPPQVWVGGDPNNFGPSKSGMVIWNMRICLSIYFSSRLLGLLLNKL